MDAFTHYQTIIDSYKSLCEITQSNLNDNKFILDDVSTQLSQCHTQIDELTNNNSKLRSRCEFLERELKQSKDEFYLRLTLERDIHRFAVKFIKDSEIELEKVDINPEIKIDNLGILIKEFDNKVKKNEDEIYKMIMDF